MEQQSIIKYVYSIRYCIQGIPEGATIHLTETAGGRLSTNHLKVVGGHDRHSGGFP